jgi:hypothetical protein
MARRWVGAVALLALLVSLVACGDDDSTAASNGHGGKNHDGGGVDGGTVSDADAGDGGRSGGQQPKRDGGGSGTSDRDASTSGGGGDGTGDISSIWKRVSSQIAIIDTANPAGAVQKTIAIPAIIPEPIEGHDIDAYQQIKDDKLLTYAHRDGDGVYYVFSSDATKVDSQYISSTNTGDFLSLMLQDGHLTETRAFEAGPGISASTITTFDAYDGDFPPKGWPTKKIEVP